MSNLTFGNWSIPVQNVKYVKHWNINLSTNSSFTLFYGVSAKKLFNDLFKIIFQGGLLYFIWFYCQSDFPFF